MIAVQPLLSNVDQRDHCASGPCFHDLMISDQNRAMCPCFPDEQHNPISRLCLLSRDLIEVLLRVLDNVLLRIARVLPPVGRVMRKKNLMCVILFAAVYTAFTRWAQSTPPPSTSASCLKGVSIHLRASVITSSRSSSSCVAIRRFQSAAAAHTGKAGARATWIRARVARFPHACFSNAYGRQINRQVLKEHKSRVIAAT